jgi:hypothetical protein
MVLYMEKKDLLTLAATFIFGLVAGGYLYVTQFTKFSNPDAVASQTESGMTIIGEVYGSCQTTCPSFQILPDGSYRFQYQDEVSSERTIKEGVLPLPIQQRLKRALIHEELVAQSQPTTPTTCQSKTAGIDIRYKITDADALFAIDSCGTAVNGAGEVWNSLSAVWTYFESIRKT